MVHDIQFSNCFVNYEKHIFYFQFAIFLLLLKFSLFILLFMIIRKQLSNMNRIVFQGWGSYKKHRKEGREMFFLGEGSATK